jgi:hypothetical protein
LMLQSPWLNDRQFVSEREWFLLSNLVKFSSVS